MRHLERTYMKLMNALCALVLLAATAVAQNEDCRQPWMPKDTPAFCAWDKEPSLPEARTYAATSMADNHIYVFGGFRYDSSKNQVIYYDSVLQSTIGADGHLGPWTVEPAFSGGRSGAAAVTVGSCAFLVGGSSSTVSAVTYYDDVQYAKIGKDGHLSSWAKSPSHLRIPRSNLSLVALTTNHGTFLNAVAGVTQIGPDTVHLDTMEFAKVLDNCAVSDWTVANYHLKGGRSTPQALSVRNNIVVIGGWGDLDQIDVYDDVETSSVRPDGSPAPWRVSLGRLTSGIYGHATVFAEAKQRTEPSLLLSIGGQPGTGAYANWISYAYVFPGLRFPDAIGIWRIAGTGRLPDARAGLGAVEWQHRLYVIGGNDAQGQYSTDVISARFDMGLP
jgi:hypothetical protein